jgi:hypothetical protein
MSGIASSRTVLGGASGRGRKSSSCLEYCSQVRGIVEDILVSILQQAFVTGVCSTYSFSADMRASGDVAPISCSNGRRTLRRWPVYRVSQEGGGAGGGCSEGTPADREEEGTRRYAAGARARLQRRFKGLGRFLVDGGHLLVAGYWLLVAGGRLLSVSLVLLGIVHCYVWLPGWCWHRTPAHLGGSGFSLVGGPQSLTEDCYSRKRLKEC